MKPQPRAFRNVSDMDSGLASASGEAQAGDAQALTPGSGLVAVPDSENFGDPDQSDREYVATIQRTLRAARKHLGVEVAFISEFAEDDRVFRYVDAEGVISSIAVGGKDPRRETYCHYVASGEIPEYLQDPSQHPLASSLTVTEALPIGTHLSVPIRFSDGHTYGTFCCFDHRLRSDIEPHALVSIRMMADLVAEYLEVLDNRKRQKEARRNRIGQILQDEDALMIFVQPIVNLASTKIVGIEALARFKDTDKGPAWFFEEAAEVGLGAELELKALGLAIKLLDVLPLDMKLNVNLSPETLVQPACDDILATVPPGRLVIEVTEHSVVNDYTTLNEVGSRLVALGIGTSIDDVGAGFSGLVRILQTAAEELKIDRAIVSDVHNDIGKQALIEALVTFCSRTNRRLLAEGVESEAELKMLRSLGVGLAQGYYFARPAPVDQILPGAVAG